MPLRMNMGKKDKMGQRQLWVLEQLKRAGLLMDKSKPDDL
jgi:hypothetical protein